MTTLPGLAEPDLPLPTPGSEEWSALLFTPEGRRRGFAAALACRREIAALARSSSDEGVARVRLAWWREEAGLLATGRPRHPATRHLAAATPDAGVAAAALVAMLEAAERDLAGRRYDDFQDLHAHCVADGGAFFELAARTAGGWAPDAAAVAALRELGAGTRLVGLIRSLHQDAVQGRCYLPTAACAEYAVTLEDCLRPPPGDGLRAVLGRTAEQARGALARGLGDLPTAAVAPSASPLVLTALAARLLRRLERRDFPVIGHWTELNGLGKLLTAWNAARRSLHGRPPKLAGIKP